MIAVKKIILRGVLILEVMTFAAYYCFGSHGIKAIRKLKSETVHINSDIDRLKLEINGLKNDMQEWETYPWYRERIAREELQYGYPTEEIIII